jgi:hypothetical protein
MSTGIPSGSTIGENRDIEQALITMGKTLRTVQDYLNYFVNDLWDKVIDEDFSSLKTAALEALGPQETTESTQKLTINRLLNVIIQACNNPQSFLDTEYGSKIRERIENHYFSADVLNFENKVLLGIKDKIKDAFAKGTLKKILEWIVKGLKAANTILDSLKKVWTQLEVVEELKKHLENLPHKRNL